MEFERIFVKYRSDRGLTFRIYRELKKNQPTQKWDWGLTKSSQKKTWRGGTNSQKKKFIEQKS